VNKFPQGLFDVFDVGHSAVSDDSSATLGRCSKGTKEFANAVKTETFVDLPDALITKTLSLFGYFIKVRTVRCHRDRGELRTGNSK
jgi:hypothetical protein